MSWIQIIPYKNATGQLKRLYDKVKGKDNSIDHILQVHSLRPHSLTGHMTLYKNVLHHQSNTLPQWYLECIGVYVSMLNNCSYCVEHHFEGFVKIVNGADLLPQDIRKALSENKPELYFHGSHLAGFQYVAKLTMNPSSLREGDISALRSSGFSDGEILEINQVCAYFNYANRTVLGLGVEIGDEKLGLSPGDSSDPTNWSHQ